MSDTQDQLRLRQRHIQQRQILAMMGIDQWVQPQSSTLNIADISSAIAQQPVPLVSEVAPVRPEFAADTTPTITDYRDSSTVLTPVANEQHSIIDNAATATSDTSAIHTPEVSNAQSSASKNIATVIAPLVETAQFPVAERVPVISDPSSTQKTVAPFDLQGGRYGNWVLMVDIQALNNDTQKLWHNITQALSLSCETSSFPICDGMDTAELANASLAGYVFKIGRSETVLVAALTQLPDGLEHPNLIIVPTLEEMLADSTRKRALWEQLSS